MIAIAVAMLALFGAVLTAERGRSASAQEGGNVPDSGFGVYLTTDKVVYAAGQPIKMELCVFNRTDEKVALQFRSAQRFDFAIEDGARKKVWRWSEGRMFAQMLGQESLGPGRTQVVYNETYTGNLRGGTYKLTGTVTASDRPMSASVTVDVR